jgi:hypothetical protein
MSRTIGENPSWATADTQKEEEETKITTKKWMMMMMMRGRQRITRSVSEP